MKRIELYQKEILTVVADGEKVAVNKETGEITGCNIIACKDCLFGDFFGNGNTCEILRKKWLTEDIEKSLDKGEIKSEIVKHALEYVDFGVSVATGKAVLCDGYDCKECVFCPEFTGESCDRALEKILFDKDTENKRKLTVHEKDILKIFSPEYKWLARNKYGFLTFFEKEPYNIEGCWCSDEVESKSTVIWNEGCNRMFKFITAEDKEPTEIEKLLEEKE